MSSLRPTGIARRLSGILRPPSEPERERPSSLIYALDERPPLATTLVLSAQHALMALMFVIYSVIAAQQIGLSASAVTAYVASCVLIMGLATIVQTLRSSIGSGHLLIHTPNPLTLGGYVAVTSIFGIEATAGAIIISGIAVYGLSGVIPKLRTVFPPEVSGVVVTMLGLSLIQPGVERATQVDATGIIDGASVLIALVTLATIIVVSVWSSKRLKIFALAIGVGVGFALGALLGGSSGTSAPAASSEDLFAVPLLTLDLPRVEFVLMATVPILIMELINAVDAIGGALTSDKMNDANWRRADMPMVARALKTLGLSTIASGFAGTLTTTISSSNIGLMHATGVTARVVGTATGLLLIALAFIPPVFTVLANAPDPVIGAVILYTAGYMIASGMELILSRLLNDRRTIMIGLSIVAGSSVMLLPALTAQAPDWSRSLVSSGITVGTLTAIFLNLLFRIGVRQSASIEIGETDGPHQAWRFLQDQGGAWGARRAVMARAGSATGEAIEALRSSKLARGPLRLTASFDEYLVTCDLSYEGPALPLRERGQARDLSHLLEDDDEEGLDMALEQMSATIVQTLADRVRVDQQGSRARLRLAFEH